MSASWSGSALSKKSEKLLSGAARPDYTGRRALERATVDPTRGRIAQFPDSGGEVIPQRGIVDDPMQG